MSVVLTDRVLPLSAWDFMAEQHLKMDNSTPPCLSPKCLFELHPLLPRDPQFGILRLKDRQHFKNGWFNSSLFVTEMLILNHLTIELHWNFWNGIFGLQKLDFKKKKITWKILGGKSWVICNWEVWNRCYVEFTSENWFTMWKTLVMKSCDWIYMEMSCNWLCEKNLYWNHAIVFVWKFL